MKENLDKFKNLEEKKEKAHASEKNGGAAFVE